MKSIRRQSSGICTSIFGGFIKFMLPSQISTWNLKMTPWNRRFLLESIIFRFHVKFGEGIFSGMYLYFRCRRLQACLENFPSIGTSCFKNAQPSRHTVKSARCFGRTAHPKSTKGILGNFYYSLKKNNPSLISGGADIFLQESTAISFRSKSSSLVNFAESHAWTHVFAWCSWLTYRAFATQQKKRQQKIRILMNKSSVSTDSTQVFSFPLHLSPWVSKIATWKCKPGVTMRSRMPSCFPAEKPLKLQSAVWFQLPTGVTLQ